MLIYIRKAFVMIEVMNDILYYFRQYNSSSFILYNEKIITPDKIQLFKSNYSNGFGMHNNILYLFDGQTSLKYNCVTAQEAWFCIPNMLVSVCKYVNNKFYFFDSGGKCNGIFDPQDDKFYTSNLSI